MNSIQESWSYKKHKQDDEIEEEAVAAGDDMNISSENAQSVADVVVGTAASRRWIFAEEGEEEG